MDIYDYNLNQASAELLPPSKRKPTTLAYLSVSDSLLQFYHDLFFTDYTKGTSYDDWISASTYSYKDKVRYEDGSVYQMINELGITGVTTSPKNDAVNWVKILNNWIGVRERVQYGGQKIMLEFLLNRIFSLFYPSINPALPFAGASHTTQIYIANSNGFLGFYMGNGGSPFQAHMGNGGATSQSFLGNAYDIDNFTVFVPNAVDAAIAAKQISGITAETMIRSTLDKYIESGKNYKYNTY